MLVVETVARIRREFFVKGKSIKEIVRDLGVSRNTVRKVLRWRPLYVEVVWLHRGGKDVYARLWNCRHWSHICLR